MSSMRSDNNYHGRQVCGVDAGVLSVLAFEYTHRTAGSSPLAPSSGLALHLLLRARDSKQLMHSATWTSAIQFHNKIKRRR